MSLFGNFTKGISSFLDFSKKEEDIESLSYDELLRKVSEINSENISLQNSIKEISKENYLLTNSIINNNNTNNSEFSKFLNLMQINLLHKISNNNTRPYTNEDFKKFLYKEKLFYGCLDEDDINILLKAKKDNILEWDNDQNKEKNKLKQEILEKNLKNLYSNMFTVKVNKKEENKNKKIEDENINRKKNENIDKNVPKKEKKKDKKIFDDKLYSNFQMNNYNLNENKQEKKTNLLEDLIFNDDAEN